MTALKPYPAYRDSGVEWLGKVPEHWEVRGNRWLFRERNETGFGSLPIMEVSIHEGVRIRDMDYGQRKQQIVDRSQYKRAQNGDIAYNTMRMWQGAVGVVPVDGLVSPAYVVACPVEGVDPRYYGYLLRTRAYQQTVKLYSRGIVSDRDRLYWDEFKRIASLLPPQREQTAIVEFLNDADRRIRRYVRAKERLIELLEEQKRALIHETVTGRIDVRTGQPYPAYKDSGVEWLGKVPKHWQAKRIKTLARPGYKTFVDGDWIESPYITSDGIRLIQTGNIGIGEYREKGFRYISERTFDEFGCTEINPGDVLICRLGLPVARACLAPSLRKRMITSVDVCILRPRDDMSPAYLVYTMSSRRYLGWVASLVRGSTRDRVSRSMLGSFAVPVPPSSEQTAIVEFLDREGRKLQGYICAIRRQIDLLREYRTRLIADVVTGKLDVREAAADLPETDPFTDGNRTDIIHPAPHPHPAEHGMVKEAIP